MDLSVSGKINPSAHTNRLAGEKSPYLLQHQHNPVDWFPWGEEAFARRAPGKQADLPEHRLLDLPLVPRHGARIVRGPQATADFLNAHFVSIKVDREERPDVDKIYMTAVQAMTGQGGWPLNCFLTPGLEAVLRRNLFPAGEQPRPGQFHRRCCGRSPSSGKRGATRCWRLAGDFHQKLEALHRAASRASLLLSPALLANAAAIFKREYDPRFGGFGGAPKFPRPSQPLFPAALRRSGPETPRPSNGAAHLRPHGGRRHSRSDWRRVCPLFGRCQWLVPHFEKMLYDNAQLVNLYLDAYLAGGEARHAATARDIIRYVLRDMTDPARRFLFRGRRGQRRQGGKILLLDDGRNCPQLLTRGEFRVAARYFGVTERGKLRGPQRSRSVAGPERPEHCRSAI